MAEHLLLEGKRVLIADDEPFSRKIITQMIEKLGCTAIKAVEDGDSAAAALMSGERFHVVILDFRMPGRNGLEILKSVRLGESKVSRDQRVMMLTGSNDYGLLGTAMALDADAFVVKPITLLQLAERLGGVFKNWGDLKTPYKYGQVDIEEISLRLKGTLPPVPAPPPPPARPMRGRRTKLEDVQAGMILAEDLLGPQNQLVLASGVQLSQRLIRRLIEVKEMIVVSDIWIEAETVGQN